MALNPLEVRERPIITPGSEILGGVLLTRTGIVVDYDENPAPYEHVYGVVDGQLSSEQMTEPPVVAEAVHATVKTLLPYSEDQYKAILKKQVELRGGSHLDRDDQVGLSTFIFNGGICHQQALLSGAMFTLLKQRRALAAEISIESAIPNEAHPDRHVRAVLRTDTEFIALETGQVSRSRRREPQPYLIDPAVLR